LLRSQLTLADVKADHRRAQAGYFRRLFDCEKDFSPADCVAVLEFDAMASRTASFYNGLQDRSQGVGQGWLVHCRTIPPPKAVFTAKIERN
jgi:hypothetical protein